MSTVRAAAGALLIGALAGTTLASEGSRWKRKADMPTGRMGPSAVTAGGQILVMGGISSTTKTWEETETMAVEVYDPAADRWTARKPAPLSVLGLAAVEGRVFAFGMKATFELDPVADAWTARAPMPTPRNGFGTAVMGGKVYVIGGLVADPKRKPGSSNTNVVEEYDPKTDTWKAQTPMFTPRHQMAVLVLGNLIYTLGGAATFPDDFDRDTDRVEIYDPATDRWSVGWPMAMPLAYFSAFEHQGKIVALPGSHPRGALQEYDPAKGRWRFLSEGPLTARWRFAAAAAQGKIYLFGGMDRAPWDGSPTKAGLAVTEEYQPGEE